MSRVSFWTVDNFGTMSMLYLSKSVNHQNSSTRYYTSHSCIGGSKKLEVNQLLLWIMHRPKVNLPGRLFRSETGL
jgi:hypothetical protein